jgi:hypothetical protein
MFFTKFTVRSLKEVNLTVDWIHFTPLTSLAGGLMIGLAVVFMAVFDGRIAGISGIVGGLLRLKSGDLVWRALFLLGLLAAPLVYQVFAALPSLRIDGSRPLLAAAGLLVGFGTRLGNGCTSGHGVCGLARRSPRSLAATLAFMMAGAATVFLARHFVG